MFERINLLFPVLALSIISSCSAFPADLTKGPKSVEIGSTLAAQMYPNDPDAQLLFTRLTSIIKRSRERDPFRGGKGPGIPGFKMHNKTLGIAFNTDSSQTDLILLNWKGPVQGSIVFDEKLTQILGFPVHSVKQLPIPTGSLSGIYRQVRIGNTSISAVNPAANQDSEFKRENRFVSSRMDRDIGVVIHESYHGMDTSNLVAHEFKKRVPLEDFFRSPELQKLTFAYLDLSHKIIAQYSSTGAPSPDISENLSLLRATIQKIKQSNPDFWELYKNYEYIEGMAEYVSAQTLIDEQLTSAAVLIQRERTDSFNAAFYRTGAVGGIYMNLRFQSLDWTGTSDDFRLGIWENLILREGNIPEADPRKLDALLNGLPEDQVKAEVDLLLSYSGFESIRP